MGNITSKKKARWRVVTFPSFIKDFEWAKTRPIKMCVSVPQKLTFDQRRELYVLAEDIRRAAELSDVSDSSVDYR